MSDPLRYERLRQRAELLARMRAFFADRGFLEVETPLLDDEIIPELHIEPIAVDGGQWLQASPELHMKRLLCQGLPAIFQVTRSFRCDELGRLHNPEFTLAEWYRVGDDMEAGIALLAELCRHADGSLEVQRTTYAEAFATYVGIDSHRASCAEMAAAAERLHISAPDGLNADDRDEWLNLLLAMYVEPRLGAEGPEILCEYPASQSALAKTIRNADGVEVAARFELYWRGVELANGYDELTDPTVLRRRLAFVNERRAKDGRPALPLPERLLAAMESPGLPACSGCALGFDRLAMLACDAESINEVMPFSQR